MPSLTALVVLDTFFLATLFYAGYVGTHLPAIVFFLLATQFSESRLAISAETWLSAPRWLVVSALVWAVVQLVLILIFTFAAGLSDVFLNFMEPNQAALQACGIYVPELSGWYDWCLVVISAVCLLATTIAQLVLVHGGVKFHTLIDDEDLVKHADIVPIAVEIAEEKKQRNRASKVRFSLSHLGDGESVGDLRKLADGGAEHEKNDNEEKVPPALQPMSLSGVSNNSITSNSSGGAKTGRKRRGSSKKQQHDDADGRTTTTHATQNNNDDDDDHDDAALLAGTAAKPTTPKRHQHSSVSFTTAAASSASSFGSNSYEMPDNPPKTGVMLLLTWAALCALSAVIAPSYLAFPLFFVYIVVVGLAVLSPHREDRWNRQQETRTQRFLRYAAHASLLYSSLFAALVMGAQNSLSKTASSREVGVASWRVLLRRDEDGGREITASVCLFLTVLVSRILIYTAPSRLRASQHNNNNANSTDNSVRLLKNHHQSSGNINDDDEDDAEGASSSTWRAIMRSAAGDDSNDNNNNNQHHHSSSFANTVAVWLVDFLLSNGPLWIFPIFVITCVSSPTFLSIILLIVVFVASLNFKLFTHYAPAFYILCSCISISVYFVNIVHSVPTAVMIVIANRHRDGAALPLFFQGAASGFAAISYIFFRFAEFVAKDCDRRNNMKAAAALSKLRTIYWRDHDSTARAALEQQVEKQASDAMAELERVAATPGSDVRDQHAVVRKLAFDIVPFLDDDEFNDELRPLLLIASNADQILDAEAAEEERIRVGFTPAAAPSTAASAATPSSSAAANVVPPAISVAGAAAAAAAGDSANNNDQQSLLAPATSNLRFRSMSRINRRDRGTSFADPTPIFRIVSSPVFRPSADSSRLDDEDAAALNSNSIGGEQAPTTGYTAYVDNSAGTGAGGRASLPAVSSEMTTIRTLMPAATATTTSAVVYRKSAIRQFVLSAALETAKRRLLVEVFISLLMHILRYGTYAVCVLMIFTTATCQAELDCLHLPLVVLTILAIQSRTITVAIWPALVIYLMFLSAWRFSLSALDAGTTLTEWQQSMGNRTKMLAGIYSSKPSLLYLYCATSLLAVAEWRMQRGQLDLVSVEQWLTRRYDARLLSDPRVVRFYRLVGLGLLMMVLGYRVVWERSIVLLLIVLLFFVLAGLITFTDVKLTVLWTAGVVLACGIMLLEASSQIAVAALPDYNWTAACDPGTLCARDVGLRPTSENFELTARLLPSFLSVALFSAMRMWSATDEQEKLLKEQQDRELKEQLRRDKEEEQTQQQAQQQQAQQASFNNLSMSRGSATSATAAAAASVASNGSMGSRLASASFNMKRVTSAGSEETEFTSQGFERIFSFLLGLLNIAERLLLANLRFVVWASQLFAATFNPGATSFVYALLFVFDSRGFTTTVFSGLVILAGYILRFSLISGNFDDHTRDIVQFVGLMAPVGERTWRLLLGPMLCFVSSLGYENLERFAAARAAEKKQRHEDRQRAREQRQAEQKAQQQSTTTTAAPLPPSAAPAAAVSNIATDLGDAPLLQSDGESSSSSSSSERNSPRAAPATTAKGDNKSKDEKEKHGSDSSSSNSSDDDNDDFAGQRPTPLGRASSSKGNNNHNNNHYASMRREPESLSGVALLIREFVRGCSYELLLLTHLIGSAVCIKHVSGVIHVAQVTLISLLGRIAVTTDERVCHALRGFESILFLAQGAVALEPSLRTLIVKDDTPPGPWLLYLGIGEAQVLGLWSAFSLVCLRIILQLHQTSQREATAARRASGGFATLQEMLRARDDLQVQLEDTVAESQAHDQLLDRLLSGSDRVAASTSAIGRRLIALSTYVLPTAVLTFFEGLGHVSMLNAVIIFSGLVMLSNQKRIHWRNHVLWNRWIWFCDFIPWMAAVCNLPPVAAYLVQHRIFQVIGLTRDGEAMSLSALRVALFWSAHLQRRVFESFDFAAYLREIHSSRVSDAERHKEMAERVSRKEQSELMLARRENKERQQRLEEIRRKRFEILSPADAMMGNSAAVFAHDDDDGGGGDAGMQKGSPVKSDEFAEIDENDALDEPTAAAAANDGKRNKQDNKKQQRNMFEESSGDEDEEEEEEDDGFDDGGADWIAIDDTAAALRASFAANVPLSEKIALLVDAATATLCSLSYQDFNDAKNLYPDSRWQRLLFGLRLLIEAHTAHVVLLVQLVNCSVSGTIFDSVLPVVGLAIAFVRSPWPPAWYWRLCIIFSMTSVVVKTSLSLLASEITFTRSAVHWLRVAIFALPEDLSAGGATSGSLFIDLGLDFTILFFVLVHRYVSRRLGLSDECFSSSSLRATTALQKGFLENLTTRFGVGIDLYSLSVTIDGICFLIVLFGYYSLFPDDSASSVLDSFKSNLLPGPLVVSLLAILLFVVFDRVIYLAQATRAKFVLHVVTILAVHGVYIWWRSVIGLSTASGILLLLLKQFQAWLGATQLRRGYPLVRHHDPFSTRPYPPFYMIYYVYRGVPFLFEMRSLLDWTFTRTALPCHYWLKLEDIAHEVYMRNIDRYDHKQTNPTPGFATKFIWKLLLGFLVFVGLFVVMFFPLMYYSTFNPSLQDNHITEAEVQCMFGPISTWFRGRIETRTVQPPSQQWLGLVRPAFRPGMRSSGSKVEMFNIAKCSSFNWQISPPALELLRARLEKAAYPGATKQQQNSNKNNNNNRNRMNGNNASSTNSSSSWHWWLNCTALPGYNASSSSSSSSGPSNFGSLSGSSSSSGDSSSDYSNHIYFHNGTAYYCNDTDGNSTNNNGAGTATTAVPVSNSFIPPLELRNVIEIKRRGSVTPEGKTAQFVRDIPLTTSQAKSLLVLTHTLNRSLHLEDEAHALGRMNFSTVKLASIRVESFWMPVISSDPNTASMFRDISVPCLLDFYATVDPRTYAIAQYSCVECAPLFSLGNNPNSSYPEFEPCLEDPRHNCSSFNFDEDPPSIEHAPQSFYFYAVNERVPDESGILPNIGIVALYTTFVIAIWRVVRGIFSGMAYRTQLEDMSDPDKVKELIDLIYLSRESKRKDALLLEEALYFELLDLLRGPDGLLKVTGLRSAQMMNENAAAVAASGAGTKED